MEYQSAQPRSAKRLLAAADFKENVKGLWASAVEGNEKGAHAVIAFAPPAGRVGGPGMHRNLQRTRSISASHAALERLALRYSSDAPE
jgi:hypothetical protein